MSFLVSLPPHGPARDTAILRAIADGRLDPPRWYALPMGRALLEVSRDYVTIDDERVPMGGPVAQAAADALDALLPTPAIVDAIEAEPAAIVTWLPTQPPGPAMLSSEALARCEDETRAILADYPGSDTALLAGHRKDVVIAPVMRRGQVTIYGARWKAGGRIQPVSSVHEEGYHDYSHGVRLVRRACLLDGKPALLEDVLARGLCGGPVAWHRYPTTAPEPRPTPTVSAVLRRGHRGPQVVELQTLLVGAGYPVQIDGIFGEKTEQAVRAFQKAQSLTVDGLAGSRTLTALRGLGDTDRPPPAMPIDAARALGVKAPLSEAEIDALFGPIEWAPVAGDPSAIVVPASWKKANLTTVKIPQLVGIEGAPKSGMVQVNKRIAEPFRAMFDAWERRKKLSLIVNWGGTVADRRVRGGSIVSRHARGIAWDFNTKPNWRGTPGAARGTYGSVVELFEEYVEYGFASGAFYQTPDVMHGEGA